MTEPDTKQPKKPPKKSISLTSAKSCSRLLNRISRQLQQGTILPGNARALISLTRVFIDSLKASEHEKRIAAIEEALIQSGRIKE